MSNHIGEPKRVVVCAANRYKEENRPRHLVPIIVLGARHFDERMREQIRVLELAGYMLNSADWEQGFIDQYGEFMTREEALKVAEEAGQLNIRRYKTKPVTQLFNEDLY